MSENDIQKQGQTAMVPVDETLARYSALADGKQLFASKYVLELPTVEQLETQIESMRREFEEDRA